MKFTVLYSAMAAEELTALWLNSVLRDAVTKAAHQIDIELKFDPGTKGLVGPDGRRVLSIYPLTLLFEVRPDDRLVRVLHVWEVKLEQINGFF